MLPIGSDNKRSSEDDQDDTTGQDVKWQQGGLDQILPTNVLEKIGPILSAVISLVTAVGSESKLVQSSLSLPSFPWLPVGTDRREDWTSFRRWAVSWTSSKSYVHHLGLFFNTIVLSLSCLFALQNVVQSSLLGYRWEVTAARIGPNFVREWSGKIWSDPLCRHFLGYR